MGLRPLTAMSYSTKIVKLNAGADPEALGVQLGRLCIYLDKPVSEVAADLGVTRTVVYRWFSGNSEVGKHLRDKVLAYYRSILPPNRNRSARSSSR